MNTIPAFTMGGVPVMTDGLNRDNGGEGGRAVGFQLPERIDGFTYDPSLTKTANKRRAVRMLRNQSAVDAIGKLPKPGEEVLIVMAGTFHGIDLVEAILKLAGCTAKEAWLATLGINIGNMNAVVEHLDAGRIERLTMLVADVFAQKDTLEFGKLSDAMHQRGQRLIVSRNHAKLALFKFANGDHIVLHGSLNLRRCNSFEQVAISNDREAYEFFTRFIDDVEKGAIEV